MTLLDGALGALATMLEVPLVQRDPYEPLDAIVVLGAPLGPGATLSAVLAERVAAAAWLFREGGGRLVVATGGISRGATRPEAAVIGEALVASGIPAAAVVVETASRTTEENARFTTALLRERGVRTVWIVSQPFHGRRAARLFRHAGLEPRVWHIETSLEYQDRRRAVRWLVREYVAWALLLGRARRSR